MKYIIVNSIAEGHRYIRKENRKAGNTMVNVCCLHLVDFAKNLVIKKRAKKGILKALNIADGTETVVLMEEILERNKGKDFFVPEESFCFDTAREVLESIRQIRMGKGTKEYENADDKKIFQIKSVITEYESALQEKDLYDDVRLYQEALEELESEGTKNGKDSYEIWEECFENLSYLERSFLEKMTSGNYEKVSLFASDKQVLEESLKGATFFKTYGIANEVNYVVADILKNKRKLGDVAVFYTNAAYEPYLEACFSEKRMPYKMVSRQRVSENRYVSFMYAVLKWAGADYSYQALKPVVTIPGMYGEYEMDGEKKSLSYSYAYYKVINAGIGWGLERYKEFSNNADMSKAYNVVMAKFFKGLYEVFETKMGHPISYAEIFEKLWALSKECLGNHMEYKDISGALSNEKKMLQQMDAAPTIEKVVDVLLDRIQKLCWSDSEENDAILVEKLSENVHVLERKHVYFIGLSVAQFSKNSVDSPVLSDEELYKYLDTEAGNVIFKSEGEQKVVQGIYKTIATKIPEGTLAIGYNCFDTIHLRKEAPSVCYLRMMEMANVSEDGVVYAGYPELIAEDVQINKKSLLKTMEKNPEETEEKEEKKNRFSTTSLEQILGCPLQYYYQRIAGIVQETYKVPDATVWLAANERGTLVHGILEEYCKKWFVGKCHEEISGDLQEESFEQIAEEEIEKMVKVCPYLSKAVFEAESVTVKEICKAYLEDLHTEFSDAKNQWMVKGCEIEFDDVVLCYDKDGACDIGTEDSVELCFTGKIDRLDYYVDSKGMYHYRIVDYKTGSAKKQREKIAEARKVQHIVYAKAILELAKREGINARVDYVQFLHIFDKEERVLNYGIGNIEEFPDVVREVFVEVLLKGHYRSLEECECNKGAKRGKLLKKSDCSYCTYVDICKKYIGDEL